MKNQIQKAGYAALVMFIVSISLLSLVFCIQSSGMMNSQCQSINIQHEGMGCTMNVFDHIAYWKSFFEARTSLFIEISFLLIFACASFCARKILRFLTTMQWRHYLFYRKYTIRTIPPSYVSVLFSKGVLHTQVYA